MSGPLEGIRVLELGEIVQGPLAGQTLGDLGADVVKIEHGQRGDAMRILNRDAVENGWVSSHFVALNRNKRSVSVDLKTSSGLEAIPFS